MLTVVRVFRPVEHANLKVRTTLVRYPLNATGYYYQEGLYLKMVWFMGERPKEHQIMLKEQRLHLKLEHIAG
jgi:hypothetical protein